MISVIIPSYNSGKYIFSAIKSVLEQTYQDFELIVVDDGSIDDTERIVNSFKDKRIKYIYQENSGVSGARNTGLKNTNGEYIAFLDADDTWLSEKLAIQHKKIMQDKEICMVYSAINMFKEDTNYSKTQKYKELNRHKFIEKLLTDPFKTIPYPSTVLIRKSYLDRAGDFNPELLTGEDWDLWLRLAILGKCSYIEQTLVKKKIHNASITSSIDLESSEKYHFKLLNNFFLNNPNYKSLKSKAYAMIYYDLTCRYLFRNNHLPTYKFYSTLIKSIFSYPPLYFRKDKLKFIFNAFVKS